MPVALWKKKNAAARVRREYKTAEEVVAAAGEAPAARPAQAILDMRGPQARVVTNMEHLNVQDVSVLNLQYDYQHCTLLLNSATVRSGKRGFLLMWSNKSPGREGLTP